MRKYIAALIIVLTGIACAKGNTAEKWPITLGQGSLIGMVDGYDQFFPTKIIGRNIWQSHMSINLNGQQKSIPIAYIVTDQKKLDLAWIGDAATGKENLTLKKELEIHGFESSDLLKEIRAILLSRHEIID
jgi:hypothetical protein